MQITMANLDKFMSSLRKRLETEITDGAPVEFDSKTHYPDPPFTEVEGQVFPYPAVGETVCLRIGICPDIKFDKHEG